MAKGQFCEKIKSWKWILYLIPSLSVLIPVLLFFIGYFSPQGTKKPNKENTMSSSMEKQKKLCRRYCQEMDKKDCLENSKYIKCVEKSQETW